MEFQVAHEGERVAEIAPGIESGHSGREVGEEEAAGGLFELGAKRLECSVEFCGGAFEEDAAEAGGLEDGERAKLAGAGERKDGVG